MLRISVSRLPFLALILVWMSSGCGYHPQKFDMAKADRVELHVSTMEDVRRLLGVKPALIRTDDGVETWVFQYMDKSRFLDYHLVQFAVGFDRDGIVQNIYRRPLPH